jgi:predicted deacylase
MAELAPYRTPDQRDSDAHRLAERAGGEVVAFGESVEGRPLRVVRVPGPGPDAPRVLCAAGIHGIEVVAPHVALAFLEALADGRLPTLRERAEVWVAPSLNPDGQARTFEREGRGGLGALRVNARGVDLNRNFPLPHRARPSWIPAAGSRRPGDATYRGPVPFSEPETRAVDALLGRCRFHAVASLHSTMGAFIPARVTDRPAFDAYHDLGRAFAGAQRVRYRTLHSRTLDVFTGELEDHAHHHHHAWAACVEIWPVWVDLRARLRERLAFWRMNPRDPDLWAANDVPALAAFFAAALDRPPPGRAGA